MSNHEQRAREIDPCTARSILKAVCGLHDEPGTYWQEEGGDMKITATAALEVVLRTVEREALERGREMVAVWAYEWSSTDDLIRQIVENFDGAIRALGEE